MVFVVVAAVVVVFAERDCFVAMVAIWSAGDAAVPGGVSQGIAEVRIVLSSLVLVEERRLVVAVAVCRRRRVWNQMNKVVPTPLLPPRPPSQSYYQVDRTPYKVKMVCLESHYIRKKPYHILVWDCSYTSGDTR